LDARTTLAALGWTAELEAAFTSQTVSGLEPARVVAEHRGVYVVRGADGEALAHPRGRLRDAAAVLAGFLPAVGDWVAVRPSPDGRSTVEAVLPRRTAVVRKTALGKSDEQVLVANVDTIFVVTDLDGDLNPRRLERYLTIVWDSGAVPVVVLTKLDLCHDRARVAEAEAVAIGVPVLAVSNVTGEGLEALDAYLLPTWTVALLGSSGVGKTTLVNRLRGNELLPTRETGRDGRGRHVTRHRELYELPGGALLVDTPGLRELQVWEGDLDDAFADIAELAAGCRFNDCAHRTEPGCAVRDAVDPERLASYRKLERELEAVAARRSSRVARELKQRWKQRARETRHARRRGLL
jgi:ribosome biogenesis GTPase / thiamine phosphate phosphatase